MIGDEAFESSISWAFIVRGPFDVLYIFLQLSIDKSPDTKDLELLSQFADRFGTASFVQSKK